MKDFKTKLSNYASLDVKVGTNLQPGQTLHIRASLDARDFVREVVAIAYDEGAKHVYVDWSDDVVTRLKYEKAPLEAFQEFPEWKAMERTELAKEGAAFMSIVSEGPNLLAGIDANKLSAAQEAGGKALVEFRRLMQADGFSWTVIATPSQDWADEVFAELPEEERVPALWEAIFKAVRADLDDPVAAWESLDETLHEKSQYLNDQKIVSLHYKAPGTDLTIGLPKGHLWTGGSSVNKDGHIANVSMGTFQVQNR